MPTSTKARLRGRTMFEPEELYTPAEIAERLKISLRQARRYAEEGRFPPGGVVGLPRGRRVYGWALSEFVRNRTF